MKIRLNDAVILHGETIIGWSGIEMAIGGGGLSINEHTEYSGELATAPVVWHADSVPFAQFTPLEFLLATGKAYRIDSECDLDEYSLIMYEIPRLTAPEPYECGCLFRNVDRICLPTGETKVISVRRDDQENVVEIVLSIGSSTVRVISGEVHESDGDHFRIVERDESVLVQVDGTRPATFCSIG